MKRVFLLTLSIVLFGGCQHDSTTSTTSSTSNTPVLLAPAIPDTEQVDSNNNDEQPKNEEQNIDDTAQDTPEEDVRDTLLYEHAATGLSIEYPASWLVREEIAFHPTVFFLSPSEDDGFQENVNIQFQDMTDDPMTLDEFSTLSQQQYEQMDIEAYEKENTRLGSCPALSSKYEGYIVGNKKMKLHQVWCVRGDTAIVVTYTALSETFDEYADVFQEMLTSVRL